MEVSSRPRGTSVGPRVLSHLPSLSLPSPEDLSDIISQKSFSLSCII